MFFSFWGGGMGMGWDGDGNRISKNLSHVGRTRSQGRFFPPFGFLFFCSLNTHFRVWQLVSFGRTCIGCKSCICGLVFVPCFVFGMKSLFEKLSAVALGSQRFLGSIRTCCIPIGRAWTKDWNLWLSHIKRRLWNKMSNLMLMEYRNLWKKQKNIYETVKFWTLQAENRFPGEKKNDGGFDFWRPGCLEQQFLKV